MAVGYVYDPIYLRHDTGDHPEQVARLVAIMRHLTDTGLIARLEAIPAQRATIRDIARVHDQALIDSVQVASLRGGDTIDSDTVLSRDSFEAAMYAAGGTWAATEAVLDGDVSSAFALVRPPGHHATRTQAMGFCLFNNIAISAAMALDREDVDRVAIVDIDVHHGNGTQQSFAREPRVLYASLHQHPYFPGTGDWRTTMRGSHDLLNVPLPLGTGDQGYAMAFERVIAPAVRRFDPDLILVSIGYDAHWSDPLAWMLMSLQGYARMIEGLLGLADELCQGRLALTLEGGYDLNVLAHGVGMTFRAMLDEPYQDPFGPASEPEAEVSSVVTQIARWYDLLDD